MYRCGRFKHTGTKSQANVLFFFSFIIRMRLKPWRGHGPPSAPRAGHVKLSAVATDTKGKNETISRSRGRDQESPVTSAGKPGLGGPPHGPHPPRLPTLTRLNTKV